MHRATLPFLFGLLLLACDDRGREGAACVYEGGLLGGTYRCDPGLVCNTGRASPTCEQPNLGGAGEPCGDDRNCRAELWCPPASAAACAARIASGQPCPAGAGCEAGLSCVKEPDAGTVCR